MSRKSVVFATEAYYPDAAGTPHLLTELARAMAQVARVTVVTSTRGASVDGSVEVRRVGWARKAVEGLFRRAVRVAATSVAIAWRACRSVEADIIYAVVGPTVLPQLVLMLRRRTSRVVLIVHDLYPDAAVASGLIRESGLSARLGRALSMWALRKADAVVAIGHDMGRRLRETVPAVSGNLHVIPHWRRNLGSLVPAKSESQTRRRLAPNSRFVLLVAGNLGRTHGVETLVEAERLLASRRTRDEIAIVVLGGGALASAIEERARDPQSLFVFGGQRPRSEEIDFLAAADLCYVGYSPGMCGISVPSRVPAILAAGRGILGVADENSDLVVLLSRAEVGVAVSPGNGNALALAIERVAALPHEVERFGLNAAKQSALLDSVHTAADRYLTVVS